MPSLTVMAAWLILRSFLTCWLNWCVLHQRLIIEENVGQLFRRNDITFLMWLFLFTFSIPYHFLHGICGHVDLDFEGLLSNLENALVAFGSSNLAKLWGIQAIVRVDIFVKSIQIMCTFWSVSSCIPTEYRKMQTEKSSIFGHFSRSAFIWHCIFENFLRTKELIRYRI